MTPKQERIYKYLRSRCWKRGTTPRLSDIARALEMSPQSARRAFHALRRHKVISVTYCSGGRLLRIGVKVNDEWRFTRRPSKRVPYKPEIDEWGRGPIARMRDRVRADEIINEHFYRVHDGQQFEDVRLKRHAWKSAGPDHSVAR